MTNVSSHVIYTNSEILAKVALLNSQFQIKVPQNSNAVPILFLTVKYIVIFEKLSYIALEPDCCKSET